MSDKSTDTETSYCSCCGWQEKGDEHDWSKHPETIHGGIERVRERRYGESNE